MANLYRVVYSTKGGPQHAQSVLVQATTPNNAVAAVVAADPKYTDVTSITQVPVAASGILVGS
jgi:hypothetical protein